MSMESFHITMPTILVTQHKKVGKLMVAISGTFEKWVTLSQGACEFAGGRIGSERNAGGRTWKNCWQTIHQTVASARFCPNTRIPLHGRTTFGRLRRKNVAKLTVMAARSEDVDHRSGQRTFGEKS